MKKISRLVVTITLFCIFSSMHAQEGMRENFVKELKKLEITGQWFLAFQHTKNDGADPANAFRLKRGYITFSKDLNKNISVRFTQDIITDTEGDDAGNIEMRLKYCYLKFYPALSGIFRHSYFEAGMVHRPYLDFEEKINRYRLQGTMFMERYKVVNSADFGITYFYLLGGKMDNTYTSEVSSSYPGKYGSVSLGVYNGGGYHALELNLNKTVEGRLSLRPFTNRLPGLQTTYAFITGKGNIKSSPSFVNHLLLLSYESKMLNSALQFTTGKGDMGGLYLNDQFRGKNINGLSAFCEAFFIPSKASLFLRYDNFQVKTTNDDSEKKDRLIAGLTWYFFKKNKLLLDVDILQSATSYDRTFEVVIELLF